MANWSPRTITAAVRTLTTSLGTAEVETDDGRAYFKPLDNPEGPHALASEWVGTKLASWFGLPTFDLALLDYDGAAHVLRKDGRPVKPGIGLVARAESGFTLNDDRNLLAKLSDPEAPSRLVAFDTWIRNRDRHLEGRRPNYGNLFFSREEVPKGRYRMVAMDHTHCFADQCELTPRLASPGIVRDDRVYGLFAEFVPLLRRDTIVDACASLRGVEEGVVRRFADETPPSWEVDRSTQEAWTKMTVERARFVADTLLGRLEREHPAQLSANIGGD